MRRGQITLFVIIGIVLLILLALFFLLRKPIDIETGADRQRVAPVDDLISSCLETSLERLLRKAGQNGGFLHPLPASPLAWDSDAVLVAPQRVAYWSHLKPCDNILGCEASEQPPLCAEGSNCPLFLSWPSPHESVEEQLEAALPAEIESCLDDFSSLQDQFEVEPKGDPEVDVLFGDQEVIALLEMPITITDLDSGLSLTLDEFTARADVDLARIYRLAHEVAQAERDTAFLERLTLHLISIYSGVEEPLPPMRAVSLVGQKRYWTRSGVEQILQEEILPWNSFIQVPNALAGFTPIWPSEEGSSFEQELQAGIYHYLNVKVSDENYDDVAVRFFYPYSRPYVNINGGQELLKPRSAEVGGFFVKILGIFLNDYRFRYDLTYPVIVTLTDEEAFDGRGFAWSIALEANIRNNEPVNRSMSAFSLVNEEVDLTSPLQRVKNTINIRSYDKLDGQPLPYTRVNYLCGQEFFIGETDAEGRLTTRLPYCRYGGVLRYSKEGYLGSGLDFDNFEEGVIQDVTLELWPLKEMTLTMRKRNPEQTAALLTGVPNEVTIRSESQPLNASDMVVVTFERVKETPYDEDAPMVGFFSFAAEEQRLIVDVEEKKEEMLRLLDQGILTQRQYDDWVVALDEREEQVALPRQESVTTLLAPGEYTIESYLIRNGKFTIPSETREFCLVGGGSTCIGKKSMTLNATNFTSWLSGGASLGDDPFQLNENMLYRFDQMTLYVLEQQFPMSWSDLEEYEDPETYLQGKRLLVLPTIE